MKFILENYKYENIRNCVNDFLDDDGFIIKNIDHWAPRTHSVRNYIDNGTLSKNKPNERYFFGLKIERNFTLTQFLKYRDDMIDNLDASFHRLSEFSEYLTIRVQMASQTPVKTSQGEREVYGNLQSPIENKRISFTIHSENCDVEQIEKMVTHGSNIIKNATKGNNKNISIYCEIFFSFQTVGDKAFESSDIPPGCDILGNYKLRAKTSEDELREIFYEFTDFGYSYVVVPNVTLFNSHYYIELISKKSTDYSKEKVIDDIEDTIASIETVNDRIKEAGYEIKRLIFSLQWMTTGGEWRSYFHTGGRESIIITHGSDYSDTIPQDFDFDAAYKNKISDNSSIFEVDNYRSKIVFRIQKRKKYNVGNQLRLSIHEHTLEDHYLYIDSLNESFGIGDIGSYIKKVFDRISKAPKDHKKKILIYALSAMMLNVIKTEPVVKRELMQSPDLKKTMEEKLRALVFKDPQKMKVSKIGWGHLKREEGDPKNHGQPVLKAYKIGDGRITVGWGHSEPVKNSYQI